MNVRQGVRSDPIGEWDDWVYREILVVGAEFGVRRCVHTHQLSAPGPARCEIDVDGGHPSCIGVSDSGRRLCSPIPDPRPPCIHPPRICCSSSPAWGIAARTSREPRRTVMRLHRHRAFIGCEEDAMRGADTWPVSNGQSTGNSEWGSWNGL